MYLKDNSPSETTILQLLKRFISLGCTLNEAILLSNKVISGESVFITTNGKESIEEDELDDLSSDILMSYLLDDIYYDDDIFN